MSGISGDGADGRVVQWSGASLLSHLECALSLVRECPDITLAVARS